MDLQTLFQPILHLHFGSVTYPGKHAENAVERVEPSEPSSMFYRRAMKKHLEAYKDIWAYWEDAKKNARLNLDTIENAYKELDGIVVNKLGAARITLSTSEQVRFKTSLLHNLRFKYVDGAHINDPSVKPDGERYHVEWDNETLADGEQSECQKLVDAALDLVRLEKLGGLAKHAKQADKIHNDFVILMTGKLWDMINDQLILPVRGGFEKLKGKCDAC